MQTAKTPLPWIAHVTDTIPPVSVRHHAMYSLEGRELYSDTRPGLGRSHFVNGVTHLQTYLTKPVSTR
jgi:hypothetical protein